MNQHLTVRVAWHQEQWNGTVCRSHRTTPAASTLIGFVRILPTRTGPTSSSVLHPGDAHGLEFDGVIVVEPADFPQNYGRQGPLSTALTRPNQEFSVVHAKPLPEARAADNCYCGDWFARI